MKVHRKVNKLILNHNQANSMCFAWIQPPEWMRAKTSTERHWRVVAEGGGRCGRRGGSGSIRTEHLYFKVSDKSKWAHDQWSRRLVTGRWWRKMTTALNASVILWNRDGALKKTDSCPKLFACNCQWPVWSRKRWRVRSYRQQTGKKRLSGRSLGSSPMHAALH